MKKSTLIIEAMLLNLLLGTLFDAAFSQIDLADTKPKNWFNTTYAQAQKSWTDTQDIDTVFVEYSREKSIWNWEANVNPPSYDDDALSTGHATIVFNANENLIPEQTRYTYGDTGFLTHPDSAFTIAFVVEKNGDVNNYNWIYDDAAGTSSRTLDIRWDNRSSASRSDALFIRHKNNNSNLNTTGDIILQDVIPVNTATGVVITFTPGDSMRVYINAVKVGAYKTASITPTASVPSTRPAWGGSNWSPGVDLTGYIPFGSMWDRVAGVDTVHQYIYEKYEIGEDQGLGGSSDGTAGRRAPLLRGLRHE